MRRAHSPQGTPNTLEHALRAAAIAARKIPRDPITGQRLGNPLALAVRADNAAEVRPTIERIYGRPIPFDGPLDSEVNAARLRAALNRWAVKNA